MAQRADAEPADHTAMVRQALHDYETQLAALREEKDEIEDEIGSLEEKIDERRDRLEALEADSTRWFDFTHGKRISELRETASTLSEDTPGNGFSVETLASRLAAAYGAPRDDIDEIIEKLVKRGEMYSIDDGQYRLLD